MDVDRDVKNMSALLTSALMCNAVAIDRVPFLLVVRVAAPALMLPR